MDYAKHSSESVTSRVHPLQMERPRKMLLRIKSMNSSFDNEDGRDMAGKKHLQLFGMHFSFSVKNFAVFPLNIHLDKIEITKKVLNF